MDIIFKDLPPRSIKALQNALSYAEWQFRKGGDSDCLKDAKIIKKMQEKIKEDTKIDGKY